MMSTREARLQEELDEALERIRQLESVLVPTFTPPLDWQLCAGEVRLFGALLQRDVMSHAALDAAIRVRDATVKHHKLLDVTLMKLRRKTRAHGVRIRNIPHRGYALEERSQWKLKLAPAELDR